MGETVSLRVVSRSPEVELSPGPWRRDAAALAAAASAIARVEAYMSRVPRIAVMGEFNTGKSSLVNALVGCRAAPVGLLTRTTVPQLLSFGEGDAAPAGERAPDRGQPVETMLTRDILRRVELLDTPGADGGWSPGRDTYEDLVGKLLGNVRGVVWCTLATQAWKASERRAWLRLPPGVRQNSILAVTHAESVGGGEGLQRVLGRLREEAGDLFGHIAPISTIRAMRARDDGGRVKDAVQWRESGGEALQLALFSLLDGFEKRRHDIAARAAQRITQSALSRLRSIAQEDRTPAHCGAVSLLRQMGASSRLPPLRPRQT